MSRPSIVWEWPLRLWHWAFAVCVLLSLYTGLAGDISLFEWHVRSGYTIVGLIVFRIGWAIWGGRYARFRHYWTTPGAVLRHLRQRTAASAAVHTAPGVALVVTLFVLVAVQVATGLFATDDIFNEGPLYGYVEPDVAATLTAVHHRVFWLLIALIGVHLTAHAVYALWLDDPNWRSMLTGRKPLAVPATPAYGIRALLWALAVAVLVSWFFAAL